MPSLLSTIGVLAIAAFAQAKVVPADIPENFFPGQQKGIGSWYEAHIDRDATNGHSWCGFPYTNADPVFAPDLSAMGGATYSSDPEAWKEQTRKYCGLEAMVRNPKTGKHMLMYIGDGFDPKWVKSPGSIDIMLDAFKELNGDPHGNKDDVMQPVQWHLTGRRNTKYAAPQY